MTPEHAIAVYELVPLFRFPWSSECEWAVVRFLVIGKRRKKRRKFDAAVACCPEKAAAVAAMKLMSRP